MTKESKQTRVAIYIRVSTDDQVEKYGIPLQRAAIDALIKSKGKLEDGSDAVVLAGEQYIYVDEGISGTIDFRERPAFSKLVEDIEFAPKDDKPFDAVVVYKIDRFARRLKILLEVSDFLNEHNIAFLSANESIDTSSPFGKAIFGIIGVIAELEIETTRQRTQDGRLQAIDRGIIMGQATTYGFQKDAEGRLKVLSEEAEVVKDIFDWFVYERLSAQKIADRLKQINALSPDASAIKHQKRKGTIKKKNDAHFWRMETVKNILSDRIYIGEYWYGKTTRDKTKKAIRVSRSEWKLSKYKYLPLIEPALFYQAQKQLEMLAKRVKFTTENTRTHLYLLSGLLKCANCATTLEEMISWTGDRKEIGDNSKRYSYYYKCARKNRKKYTVYCTVLPIPADALEEYILKFLMKLLEDPQMVYKHQKELLSSRNSIAHLNKLRASYVKNLNAIPAIKEAIRSQHTLSVIDDNKLMSDLAEQDKKAEAFQEEIKKIDEKLGKQELSEGYMKTFQAFAEKYKITLANLTEPDKRKELINIIHSIVDQIIVTSRPVLPMDAVAGRKTEKQFMPYGIEIKLRLPEEIIVSLAKQEFGVKTDNL